MSLSGSVSGLDQPAVVEDLYDWPKSTSRMPAQAPWWEPGTASGYHALSYGHLVGEVVRRISGKTLKQFVADEIAGPLGADFQIGAEESDWERIADVVPPPPLPIVATLGIGVLRRYWLMTVVDSITGRPSTTMPTRKVVPPTSVEMMLS